MSGVSTCQHCGTRLIVPDEVVDGVVRCPRCDRLTKTSPNVAEDRRPHVSTPPGDASAENAAIEPSCVSASAAARHTAWLLKTPEGQQHGPVDLGTLHQWIREGRVSDDCLLRETASADWQSAGVRYPVLRDSGNPFARAATPIAENQDPHRASLVLTLALVGCFVPVVSFWAAIMGTHDLRRMQLARVDSRGESVTRAGQVIATVASMVWIVVFLIGLLVLLARTMSLL